MTPAERLQAAIEKLETLRAQTGYYQSHGWLVENVTVGFEYDPREEQAPLTNDELIVTLHRTIDAQLAWLRDQRDRVARDLNQVSIDFHYRYALALADAILGSDQ